MTKMIKFVEENFPRIAKLTPLSIDILNRITPKNNESYLLIYPDKSIRLLTSEDLIREVSSGNNIDHDTIMCSEQYATPRKENNE